MVSRVCFFFRFKTVAMSSLVDLTPSARLRRLKKASALLCRVILTHIRIIPGSYRVLTTTFGKVFYREQAGCS